MYNAPAVSYPVGRSALQTGLTVAVVLVGLLAQGAWWLVSVEHGGVQWLAGVLWVWVSGWAFWALWHTPQAQLVWDGQAWCWRCGAASRLVSPQVVLDAQHSLLLCLRPSTGAALWVWPAQRTRPERWLALRRAIFNPSAQAVRTVAKPEV